MKTLLIIALSVVVLEVTSFVLEESGLTGLSKKLKTALVRD